MNNLRNIPGYYYGKLNPAILRVEYLLIIMLLDEEKKKLFKIQTSSQASATSAYSSADIKRRKVEAERIANEARETARPKDRIQRSNILKEPLTGGILQRELVILSVNLFKHETFTKSTSNPDASFQG